MALFRPIARCQALKPSNSIWRRPWSTLHTVLSNIRTAFPDRYDLYSRIETALDEKSKIKIALIPFQSFRSEIKGVLDSLISDPLASNQEWYDSIKNRLLAKDTLIKYSPKFEYTETFNSFVVYPVPFVVLGGTVNSDGFEIYEVNSYRDSYQHIVKCHFHVFISCNVQQALTNPLPSWHPSTIVLDLKNNETVRMISVDNAGKNLAVSSELAVQGIELLRKSPSNATAYNELIANSGITRLAGIIFRDPKQLRTELVKSIVHTCERIVAPREDDPRSLQQLTDLETHKLRDLREQWSKAAHVELQTTLSSALDKWQKSTLPWWKLYFSVDDIYDKTGHMISTSFLPASKTQLQYALGRIDAFAEKHYLATTISAVDQFTLIDEAQKQIIDQEAVDLHNQGLKSLSLTIFGLQLPMLVIPLLGIYFYDYSAYSMGSLIALGAVVGFRRLQKSWDASTDRFAHSVMERGRKVIEQCEGMIWNRWEGTVINEQKKVEKRGELVDELKRELTIED